MSATALALVLMAAVLHTGWNALAKRGRDQLCFLWWAITLATVAAAPISVPMLWTTGVPAAARPFLAATIAFIASDRAGFITGQAILVDGGTINTLL